MVAMIQPHGGSVLCRPLTLLWSLLTLSGLAIGSRGVAIETGLPATIRVGVSGSPPFVFERDDAFSGISVEVWRQVADRLDQPFVLVRQANAEANLKAVSERRIDLAIGPLSITPERLAEKTIDFSQPYFHGQLGLLVPIRPPGLLSRLAPFFGWAALSSLGVLMLMLFIVGNLIWLAERRRNYDQFPRHYFHGVGNGMWFALVTLTTVGYGDRAPLSRTGRTIAGVWMVLSLVALSSVTAGLASAFTVSFSRWSPGTIQRPEALVGQPIAVVEGTTSEVWARIYGARPTAATNLNAAIALLQQGKVHGVMFDRPVLRYYQRQNPSNGLKLADFSLADQTYGFAFPAGSPLGTALDVSIVELNRSGRIHAITEKTFGRTTFEGQPPSE
ncbi:putative ligand gated channel (GIC family) [Synechococcus sp. RS9909]|nr:putative ligand gated channel (GIC family) [Synechococcus sp. RS9909]